VTSPTSRCAPLVVLLLLAGCAGREPPEVPEPDLAGAEPEIAAAVEAARQAVIEAPDSAAAWGALGDRLRAHGWGPEAARCYRDAERLEPTRFDWPYLLGDVLALQDLEPATEALDRAVALDGNYLPARIRLARLLVRLDRTAEARSQFEQALALDGDNYEAWLGLGQLDLAAGRYEDARERLERARAIDAGQGELHHALAQVYLALGEDERSRESAAAAGSLPVRVEMEDPRGERPLAPAGSLARNRLGRTLEDEGRLAEALEQYRQALVNNPDLAGTHLNLARVLAATGATDEAIVHYREASRLSPDNFGALVSLAGALDEAGRRREAIELYRLGTALANEGRLDEAIGVLREAARVRPDDAKTHVNLGIALAQRGALDAARESLLEALRLDPEDGEAHYNLGFLLATQGELPSAAEHLEQALRLDPGDRQARQALESIRRRLAGGPP